MADAARIPASQELGKSFQLARQDQHEAWKSASETKQ